MRFIITAQSGADSKTTEPQSGLDVELFKAYMRFNEEMHLAGVLVASEGLNPAAKGPAWRLPMASATLWTAPSPSRRNWWEASI